MGWLEEYRQICRIDDHKNDKAAKAISFDFIVGFISKASARILGLRVCPTFRGSCLFREFGEALVSVIS